LTVVASLVVHCCAWRTLLREVGDSSQSFLSDTLQGISSEWSGDTTELVYIQKRRDLIGWNSGQ